MIPIAQIAAFCRVFELNSMTAASRSLGLTPSAISRQVSLLEASLSCRLFDRQGPRLSPTPLGRRLYPEATRVLAAHARFLALAGTVGAATLRIAASNVPGQYLVPALWSDFAHVQPYTQTTAIVNSRQALARLAAGTADVAFVGTGPDSRPELRYLVVARDRLVVIAPANRWHDKDDLLATAPWVWREQGSAIRELAENYLMSRGLCPQDLRSAGEYGSAAALVAAVRAGQGIGFTSLVTVRGDSSVRLVNGHIDRELFLVLPPSEHTSALAEDLGQFCRDMVRTQGVPVL